MIVKHTEGMGKARANAESNPRWRELFNCPMIGSWNCDGRIKDERPHIINQDWKLWLCKLNDLYCYALKWKGSKKTEIELYSKIEIPKAESYELTVYDNWDDGEVEAYADSLPNIAKFQGFPWMPGRSDSARVWEVIKENVSFSGRSVLDVGCSSGYYSMQASKAGAHVIGIDKNKNAVSQAELIQARIEGTDCQFIQGDARDLDGYTFDIILCLSVLHQIDPSYSRLGEMVEGIRECSKLSIIELITPSLEGNVNPDAIMAELGFKKVLHYRHKVRKERALYVG